MSPATRILKKLIMEVRYRISTKPSLWPLMLPFAWTRKRRKSKRQGAYGEEAFARGSYPLVVDGYPGSANSFATSYLRDYFPEGTHFGNHFHSPAETLRCLSLGVPVLLTLRHPEKAVISFVRRWDYVSLRRALRYYIWFYEALYPRFDAMVVSDFSYTTRHMEELARHLTEKHGVPLQEPARDELGGGKKGGGSKEAKSRDDSQRLLELKVEMARRFQKEIPEEERMRAEAVYRRCLEHGGTLKDPDRLEIAPSWNRPV